MPLYEYQCKGCGQNFETLRGAHEKDADVECPQCGEKKAEKLMSACCTAKGESSQPNASSCGTKRFS
ncbi:MAG: zinc ribbon domain-containing protein [Deltaproteobacteria bacterium]|jgi:putative FmdB family regulatory protein|nr:zinc ribbon domain-containing protein [Deltaproteobacteria bacterium]